MRANSYPGQSFLGLELPAITSTEDLAPAFAALVTALARGDLTPDEAQTVGTLLEQHRRSCPWVSCIGREKSTGAYRKGASSH